MRKIKAFQISQKQAHEIAILIYSDIQSYINTHTNAFKVIRDTIGEKPVDKVCMTNANVNIAESYKEVKVLEHRILRIVSVCVS